MHKNNPHQYFSSRKIQIMALLIVMAVALWLPAACSEQPAASTSTNTVSTVTDTNTASVSTAPAGTSSTLAPESVLPSPSGYSIAINVEGRTVAYFSLDQLKKMPQVKLRAADRDNEGPTLPTLIKTAGLDEFQSVKVIGQDRGRMADAELDLTRAQVNEQTVLDITNRGTCKFASPDVAFENWIYDVTALDIVK
jgi:hypothetical protein